MSQWLAGFESRLVPDLPLPFIPTLIGLRAFDLVSSPVWWEAVTNIIALATCVRPLSSQPIFFSSVAKSYFFKLFSRNAEKLCCLIQRTLPCQPVGGNKNIPTIFPAEGQYFSSKKGDYIKQDMMARVQFQQITEEKYRKVKN